MKLNKYGQIIFGIGLVSTAILALAALYGFYELVNHIWFDGTGWCWGSGQKCLGL